MPLLHALEPLPTVFALVPTANRSIGTCWHCWHSFPPCLLAAVGTLLARCWQLLAAVGTELLARCWQLLANAICQQQSVVESRPYNLDQQGG
jgi:hypothetical protein